MGYTLEAIIGQTMVLSVVTQDQASAVLVPLRQGLSLVPMTGELFDELTDSTPDRLPGFWKLPGGFDRVLCSWSSPWSGARWLRRRGSCLDPFLFAQVDGLK